MKVGDRVAFVDATFARNVKVGEDVVGNGEVLAVSRKGSWVGITFMDSLGVEVTCKVRTNTTLRVNRTGEIESVYEVGGVTQVGVEYGRINGPVGIGCIEMRWIRVMAADKVQLMEGAS